MKAEKKDTTYLLDVAGKGSVKTSVQVTVKDMLDKSPVHKPVIKGSKGKKSAFWMEERALSMLKKVMIPGVMEEKEKFPGGWNRQMDVNNTQCDSGYVERMRGRRE